MEKSRLTAGNGPDDQKGLRSGGDRFGQRGVRRLVRQILLAGEEPQERRRSAVTWSRIVPRSIDSRPRARRGPSAGGRANNGELHLAVLAGSAPASARTCWTATTRIIRASGPRRKARPEDPEQWGPRSPRHPPMRTPARRSCRIRAAGIERIDRHRITQHVDVAVVLRQTLGERLPLVSARPAAVHAVCPRAESAPNRS